MLPLRNHTFCVALLLCFVTSKLKADEALARPRLYLSPYTHLDTQWLWTYEDSINKYLKNTLDDNFALFEKYPEHQFNFTGAFRYKLMKTYWPARYEQLKSYVAAGRWHPAGSSWEENDVVLPDPESIQRQILYGNKFFAEEFGKTSVDYMLPDSFGFPASLPTVVAHAGLKGFSSQKLSWGSARGVPFNIGLWEGADGSRVLSVLDPGPYETKIPKDFDQGEWVKRLNQGTVIDGKAIDYRYYGIGDTGGSPREEDVKNLVEVMRKPNLSFDIINGASDQMFRDFASADKDKLPVVKGEMLLTEHSAGLLSSNSRIKNENRKTEVLAKQAEYLATAASYIDGTVYPKAKLRKAWETLLPVQMHDIITGTAVPQAISHSMNDTAIAQNLFRGVIDHSIGLLTQKMDLSEGVYNIIVANTLSEARSELVNLTIPKSAGTFTHARSPEGETIALQIVPNRKLSSELVTTYIFPAQLGPLETSVYTLIESPTPSLSEGVTASTSGLESNLYKVALAKSGDIASIVTKATGREELKSPIRYQFTGEFPHKYPAWNMTWKDRKRPPRLYLEGKAKVSVLYEGPWQSALRVEREALGSTFMQIIRLTQSSSLIEVEEQIHWRTRESAFKVAITPRIKSKDAFYDMGLSVEKRLNNSPKLFEMPEHRWMAMTDGKQGLSVLNACCYGSDKPADDTIRLTLLYTPHSNLDEYRYNDSQDFGEHTLKWGLMFHEGSWQTAKSSQRADALNEPLLVYHIPGSSKGPLGKRFSFLKAEGVQVKVIKQEENLSDHNRILVRVYEREGGAKKFKLQLPDQIQSVTAIDGQEREFAKKQGFKGKTFEDDIPAFGIRSYIFKLNRQSETRLATGAMLPLPYNVKAFSNKDRTLQSTIAEGKISLPVEDYPRVLRDKGVEFDLSASTLPGPDVLRAAGQTITLPKTANGNIHILAFGTRDHRAKVLIDGNPVEISIPRFHGPIADGDKRILDDKFILKSIRPAFERQTPIAAYANLSHGKEGRLSYYPSYLFHCILPGGKTIQMPEDPEFFIAAISVSNAMPPVMPLDERESNCGVSL
ncbi:MAG: alpha-mannosidase [Proteobacteria bacterium]|nr:MAG: alpha-mannosidase [Pseudomonadota bacterium]